MERTGRSPGDRRSWRSPPSFSTTPSPKFSRQAQSLPAGTTLRVLDPTPFRLRWSLDDWHVSTDSQALTTAVGIYYADVPVPEGQRAPVQFTFFWPGTERWQGTDFQVEVEETRR